MSECLANPVVWDRAGETYLSPVAHTVLRQHLNDWEEEGDKERADKNIDGQWMNLVLADCTQQEVHPQAFTIMDVPTGSSVTPNTLSLKPIPFPLFQLAPVCASLSNNKSKLQ